MSSTRASLYHRGYMWRNSPIFPAILGGLVSISPASGVDFSRAFENLRALGLPDVRDAEFGMLSQGYGGFDREFFPGLYNFEPMGNAWRIGGGGDGDGEGPLKAITKHATLSVFDRGNSSENRAYRPPTWKKVELSEQWTQIEKWLEDPEFAERLERNSPAAGSLLLFAAHLDRKGLDDEASALSEKVLSIVEDQELAVTSAIGIVAQGQYDSALATFYSDKDMKAFAVRATEIAETFGAGWHAGDGVIAMAEMMSAQPASPPPVTAPEGTELSPEQRNLASDLAAVENAALVGNFRFSSGPWLLGGERFDNQLAYLSKEQKKSPVIRVVNGGRASVPLLLALLDDLHFLPFPNYTNRNVVQRFDRMISEASPTRSRAAFPRPATRSDVAAALLLPLVPGISTGRATDIEYFSGAAKDWWAEVEEMSDLELARFYFQRGDDNQRRSSVAALTGLGEPSDLRLLEEYMLGLIPESSYEAFEFINKYVGTRGEEAEAFVKEVKAVSSRHLASIKNLPDSGYENQKQQIESQMKMLDNLFSSASAEEMLAQVAAGELDFHSIQESLIQRLDKENPVDRLGIILDAAAEAEVGMATQFLSILSYMDDGNTDTDFPPISEVGEFWTRLLDRKETSEDQPGHEFDSRVAFSIERIHAPETSGELSQFWQRVGNLGKDFIVQRARDRIAGNDLAAIPSPDEVSDERKAELETKLTSNTDPSALQETLEALSLAEKMWVAGEPVYTADPQAEKKEPLPPLQQAVLDIQYRIAEVNVPEGWDAIEKWEGEAFTAAKFDEFIGLGLEKAGEGEIFTANLSRDAGFGPLVLEVEATTREKLAEPEEPTANSLQQAARFYKTPVPYIAASPQANFYSAYWFGEPVDGSELPENRMASSIERNRDRLRSSLEQWFHPGVGLSKEFDWHFFGATSVPVE